MKIIVQNLATEYQDDGAGNVILFLHGWQDNLHTFDALASLLSSAHHIIRLDLPGFGQTETPKEIWDLDDYVEFVNHFIQKLHIEVDAIVGHSFGGRIAIKGQATKKLRPRKIILICSAGVAEKRTFRNAALKILVKAAGVITYIPPFIFWREVLRKKMYESIGSDYLNAGTLKETFLKIISEDLSSSAEKIIIPTLLIWGSNDTQTPLSEGKKLSYIIRGSELKILEKAGHFVHKEQPHVIAKLIQEFL